MAVDWRNTDRTGADDGGGRVRWSPRRPASRAAPLQGVPPVADAGDVRAARDPHRSRTWRSRGSSS